MDNLEIFHNSKLSFDISTDFLIHCAHDSESPCNMHEQTIEYCNCEEG